MLIPGDGFDLIDWLLDRAYRWLVVVAGAFFFAWFAGDARGATSLPGTVYSGSISYFGAGGSNLPSVGAVVAAISAIANAPPYVGPTTSCSGGGHVTGWSITAIAPSTLQALLTCSPSSLNGGLYGSYSSSASGCTPPQFLKGTICTDAYNGSVGVAGSVENVTVPFAGHEKAPPALVALNGLAYEAVSGTNQCALAGVQQWCLTVVSTGGTATPGVGGAIGADLVGANTTGLPAAPDVSCSGNNIVNTSTGIATCMGVIATQPIETLATVNDPASGAVSTTVTSTTAPGVSASVTSSVLSGVTTTYYGAPAGSSSGGAASGSVSVSNLPSDYARAGEAATAATTIDTSLGAALSGINSTLLDTSGASTPVATSSGVIASSLLGSNFSSLTAWVLPSRSLSCPTFVLDSITLAGITIGPWTMDQQCVLWASSEATVQAVCLLIWGVGAMFIVLGA